MTLKDLNGPKKEAKVIFKTEVYPYVSFSQQQQYFKLYCNFSYVTGCYKVNVNDRLCHPMCMYQTVF